MPDLSHRLLTALSALAICSIAVAHPDDPKARDFHPAYVGPSKNGLRGGFSQNFDSNGVTLTGWLTVGQMSAGATSAADCWGYVSSNGREYAIVGLSDGTAYVEMTDPAAPVVVGHIAGVLSLWRDIKVFGDYAYVVSEGASGNDNGGGVQVVDLSAIDSGTVTLVTTVSDATNDDSHNVALDADSGFLYRCGGGALGLRAYDLSNPSTPVLAGQ